MPLVSPLWPRIAPPVEPVVLTTRCSTVVAYAPPALLVRSSEPPALLVDVEAPPLSVVVAVPPPAAAPVS